MAQQTLTTCQPDAAVHQAPAPANTDPIGATRSMIPSAPREAWFATGSQPLHGRETLYQVASQSQVIAAALDAAPDISARIAAYYRLARGI
jgi:hypothetical protein